MKNMIAVSSLVFLAACSQQRASQEGQNSTATEGGKSAVAATIRIDGSSTVFPISEAVGEEFQKGRDARVTIGVSGTGGGMKKFCTGEIDISGASRPIKGKEIDKCKSSGIDFIELPVAYDGIAVVVNPKNDWVESMTVAELKKLWSPEAQGKIMKWSDVRAGWPDKEIHLFGAGIDSGTYDYFTKAIVGKEHSSRGDFTSSEDDNVLVKGVTMDRYALGFFGFAYYSENAAKLKLLGIDSGDGTIVKPSLKTVADGSYKPLSRPIFIYVASKSAKRPEVTEFVNYYLKEGRALVQEVGYIAMPETVTAKVIDRFGAGTTGSLFGGAGSKVGASVEDVLGK